MYFSVQLSNSSGLGPVSYANLYQLDLRHLVGIKRDRIRGNRKTEGQAKKKGQLNETYYCWIPSLGKD